MTEPSTDEREDLICGLARTMDEEAWSRADGSPFLPQGPEWRDRRDTSRDDARSAVDAGWRPPLAARPAVDVAGAGAQALRDAAEAYTDYDDDRGAAMVARRWLRARAESLAAIRVPRDAVDVEGIARVIHRPFCQATGVCLGPVPGDYTRAAAVVAYLAGESRDR